MNFVFFSVQYQYISTHRAETVQWTMRPFESSEIEIVLGTGQQHNDDGLQLNGIFVPIRCINSLSSIAKLCGHIVAEETENENDKNNCHCGDYALQYENTALFNILLGGGPRMVTKNHQQWISETCDCTAWSYLILNWTILPLVSGTTKCKSTGHSNRM